MVLTKWFSLHWKTMDKLTFLKTHMKTLRKFKYSHKTQENSGIRFFWLTAGRFTLLILLFVPTKLKNSG